MLINIVSVFPEMFSGVFAESMVKRACEKGLVQIKAHDLRDFSEDKHRRIDDAPYGGGPGMVMKPEPFFRAVRAIQEEHLGEHPDGQMHGVNERHVRAIQEEHQEGHSPAGKVILMSPQGLLLTQAKIDALSKEKHLIILCGHYEGIDERVRTHLADEEISIGDYVLTGGEIPAMVMVDALVRLIPGVLNVSSLAEESFAGGLLEYPQFTRPSEYEGMSVPPVLLSGDHEKIKKWRNAEALKRTMRQRPDLLSGK